MINTLELVPAGDNLLSSGGDADVRDTENVLEEGKTLSIDFFDN